MNYPRLRRGAGAVALLAIAFSLTPAGQAFSLPSTSNSHLTADKKSCTITAKTPYARNNLVWTGATFSGCAAPVELDLKWSRTGPDGTIGVELSVSSGTDYGWGCRWGTPQNRNLYGKAFDSNGVDDESSIKGFTSAHTNCVL